ncbi:MAG: sensor histidine kinase [Beijerinckiaceae bacterium]
MTTSESDRRTHATNLLATIAIGEEIALDGASESMWFEVIHKMDEVYSDLIRYEADLERKNAQLEEAQAFISSVIASISDSLIVCDRHGIVLQVNPSLLRIVGKTEAELIGSNIADHLVESDRETAGRVIASGAAGEVRDVDLRFLTASGQSDLMAMHCSTRFDPDRKRAGAVLTGRPISELRRAYEALNEAHLELQQAQRKLVEQEKIASLGRLVAGVAHELNNPISFVFGNVHTLARYRKNVVKYLDAVHAGFAGTKLAELRRTLRIDAIVDDLAPLIEGTLEGAARVSDIVKNLRRLSSSKLGERQPVDLGNIVRTATHLASRAKNISAEVDVDIDPNVQIDAHEGQIHQVVVNLVDNALDAVRNVANPHIFISVKKIGREVVITMADNGAGIESGILDKIFEPFFTTKVVGEGTGFGLWISYVIVREHSGTIVAANAPAGGAVFTIRLPIDAAPVKQAIG